MERKGKTGKRKKRGMNFIPYDYEAAFNKAMGDLNEWFIEQMFSHGKKMVYALKEIKAGEQFEVQFFPLLMTNLRNGSEFLDLRPPDALIYLIPSMPVNRY